MQWFLDGLKGYVKPVFITSTVLLVVILAAAFIANSLGTDEITVILETPLTEISFGHFLLGCFVVLMITRK